MHTDFNVTFEDMQIANVVFVIVMCLLVRSVENSGTGNIMNHLNWNCATFQILALLYCHEVYLTSFGSLELPLVIYQFERRHIVAIWYFPSGDYTDRVPWFKNCTGSSCKISVILCMEVWLFYLKMHHV